MLLSQEVLPPGFWMHETILGDGEIDVYDVISRAGRLNTSYGRARQVYDINRIDVEYDYRRKGVGKQLMHVAMQHATELGADAICAGITSRESYDLMRSVFGSSSVKAFVVGKYAPKYMDVHPTKPTIASLWHELR